MSKIEVDKVDPQSGTALEIGTSGDTVTVPSGVGLTLTDSTLLLPTTITSTTEVKTNKISPATGTAFALGDSGDTFTVPSGATIVNSGTSTGFGDSLRPNANPLIINGDISVAQRSTSVASITAAGYYTVDRFNTVNTTLGTWTQSQDTDVPTGSGFATSLKMDCTTLDASPAASDRLDVQQRMEGQNLQLLKKGTSDAETLTLSFWVKSVLTGTYIVELFDNDNARQISKSYTIDSGSTWEKKLVTFAGDTTGALGNDNGSSLQVCWFLAVGSDYSSGSLNTSWAANTNANRAVGQVNLANSTSNNFWITGIQLEVGEYTSSDLPPFQHESFGNNLSRCLRYYQKSYAYASVVGTNTDVGLRTTSGSAGGLTTGYLYGDIEWQVNMRAAPTVTTYDKYNGTPGVCSRLNGGVARTDAQNISAAGITEKNCTINSTGTANAGAIDVHWRAVAEL